MLNTNKPQATSPLATWLCYLEKLHNVTIDLGLERVKSVGERMGLLTPAPLVFTVAGTNGKGTTCCAIEAILMASGLKVGVYSSPHLLRYNERVRIQGQELADEEHSCSLAAIEDGRGETSLTYFEFSTLSALSLFKQHKVDVVVLEVGLGGRLDATNIVDTDVAVVTSIALDHTDYLGPDRESIGHEKAGIFRAGKPAIFGEDDMPASIATSADDKGAVLYRAGVDWHYRQTDAAHWCYESAQGSFSELPLPHIPMMNAATAISALLHSPLKVEEAAIVEGLKRAQLPGRFQQISEQPRVILDVAHNPHAAKYLAHKLTTLPKEGTVYALVGMLRDKDIKGALAEVAPYIDSWYCAPLSGPRGTSAEQIAHYVSPARCFQSVAQAWAALQTVATAKDTIIVFGSFHTVAEIMEVLEQEK